MMMIFSKDNDESDRCNRTTLSANRHPGHGQASGMETA